MSTRWIQGGDIATHANNLSLMIAITEGKAIYIHIYYTHKVLINQAEDEEGANMKDIRMSRSIQPVDSQTVRLY